MRVKNRQALRRTQQTNNNKEKALQQHDSNGSVFGGWWWQRLLLVPAMGGLVVWGILVLTKEYFFLRKENSPERVASTSIKKYSHDTANLVNQTSSSSSSTTTTTESIIDSSPVPTKTIATAAPITTITTSLPKKQQPPQNNNRLKFFLVAPPETTSELLLQVDPSKATNYYHDNLNEESAEIWLHRGFVHYGTKMSSGQQPTIRTGNPHDADVILIAGYLHLNKQYKILDLEELVGIYEKYFIATADINKNKPHLMLIPTWNPGVSNEIGLPHLVRMIEQKGFKNNVWSVGFERNPMWQKVPVEKIVPIPYVVHLPPTPQSLLDKSYGQTKQTNSVFYVGDKRPHAEEWGGCSRTKLIEPLQQQQQQQQQANQANDQANNKNYSIDVRLVGRGTGNNRLSQEEYNSKMIYSDYCLIVCGDTPTSRTLTSAWIAGCIPIQVGTRLQGRCDAPCHQGWGWAVSGPNYPHLPFEEIIPWEKFPMVTEQDLMDFKALALEEYVFQVYNSQQEQKDEIRTIMKETLSGWIYGWGDPVTSTEFGSAVQYIWNSFGVALEKAKQQQEQKDGR